jgi:SAM-dependent methyltransferase
MKELYSLIDVDISFYRDRYRDLAKFDDDQLLRHYYKYGYFEGRECHPRAKREGLVAAVDGLKALEIGPFVNPKLRHDNVKYLDVLSTEELIERAERLNKSTEGIRSIDFVARDGSLCGIDETFDVVFSSHNLEHQPDLIAHLNEVSAALNEGGVFAMMVPDARYCFDAFLPLSKISEIFNAHYEGRTRHSVGSVIEHRAMLTHNNTAKHWEEGNERRYRPLEPAKIAKALTEFAETGDAYIDVHAWQFEPLSLSDILRTLIEIDIIEFTSVSCRGPVRGRNEFSVELLK